MRNISVVRSKNLPAGENTFSREVATRVARVAQHYPEKLPYLVDFCRRHVKAHAEQLIQIAQEGEGALGHALTLLWRRRKFHRINRRIFPLLPERTVQLREFAVELVRQLISSGRVVSGGPGRVELRAILVGRLREAGRFEEALDEARRLAESPELADEPPEVQAIVWSNLGVSCADAGDWGASFEAHRRVMGLYQSLPPEHLRQIAGQLAAECVNVAAAAMRLGKWEEAEAWSRHGLDLSLKLGDAGLLLRARLVRLTLLAETNQSEALELGERVLESALDLDEIDRQSYGPLLLDVYINLGSILLDLNRIEKAASYFEAANRLASGIREQAPSIGTRSKYVTSLIALAHTQIAHGELPGLANARAALAQARALYEEAANAYQNEILMRAVEVNVAADVEFPDSLPDLRMMEELVSFPDPQPSTSHTEDLDSVQRRLHLGGMAFAKLGMKERGLWCAREAVRLAELSGENASPQQCVRHALSYDGLSRRLDEAGYTAEAFEKAEATCRMLLPAFSADQNTYHEWMYNFMQHFRDLALRLDKFDHFKDFFMREFDPLLGE